MASFNPADLPRTVLYFYKQGPLAWHATVHEAIKLGITNVDYLTDIAFHQHHPELRGRQILSNETNFILQWKNFRNLVKPIVSAKRPHVPIPYSRGRKQRLIESSWKIEEGET